jgi:Chloroplast import apparatus Tic20-like
MSSQAQTVADRFFGSLAYLLPIADVASFGSFVFAQFPIVGNFYQAIAPILQLNGGLGGLFLFILLYAGVVANPRVSRFIRFNVLQAILIGILLFLCGFPLRFAIESNLLPIAVTQVLMNTVFFGTWAIVVYGIAMSALGRYTAVPQLSETAQFQIDRF